jgi:putative Mg2+ transporter-C (MgtC) family protein
MTPTAFVLRLGCALLCGVLIGVERQWRQRTAGLRTYTLVAVGSALFVSLGALTPGDSSPTRIAGQIVTGIGFLGAGVIMRSGLNVRGLNTAGTIWCSSAVGTMAGSGFFWQSIAGAVLVLAINTLLRPLVALINRQPVDPSEQEYRYSLQLTCAGRQETQLRTLLVQLTSVSPLTLHELESVVGTNQNYAVLKAMLSSPERMDAQVEQLVSRLSLEKNVVGLNWQLLPPSRTE